MYEALERDSADSELSNRQLEWDRKLEWSLPSTPTDKSRLADHELSRWSARRPRPLTVIQEVLFFAAVFVIGGVLQALVILDVAGVIE